MAMGVAEYAILAVTLSAAVVGLFIGFSGSLAFLAGSLAAAATARFGWMLSAGWLPDAWVRGIAVAVASILAFGIVRWIVRKSVHGLVAQPGDAIFGAIAAGAVGFCISSGCIMLLAAFGLIDESFVPSFLSEVLANVGG